MNILDDKVTIKRKKGRKLGKDSTLNESCLLEFLLQQ